MNCVRCGYPRSEHHHDGACYGLCGEFVGPSTTVAQDLRALVQDIEEACRRSRVSAMAWPAVNALCDYLALRAHLMEIESSTRCPDLSSEDPPNPER